MSEINRINDPAFKARIFLTFVISVVSFIWGMTYAMFTQKPIIVYQTRYEKEYVEVKVPIEVPVYIPVTNKNTKVTSNSNKVKKKEKSEQVDTELPNKVLDIFARLVLSEAGNEPYEGKVAVAAVVLNRVGHQDFPDSITEVIFQKSQFAGVNSPLFNKKPTKDCIKAVKDAINGKDPTNGALYFLNKNEASPSWASEYRFMIRIGDHWFYKP